MFPSTAATPRTSPRKPFEEANRSPFLIPSVESRTARLAARDKVLRQGAGPLRAQDGQALRAGLDGRDAAPVPIASARPRPPLGKVQPDPVQGRICRLGVLLGVLQLEEQPPGVPEERDAGDQDDQEQGHPDQELDEGESSFGHGANPRPRDTRRTARPIVRPSFTTWTPIRFVSAETSSISHSLTYAPSPAGPGTISRFPSRPEPLVGEAGGPSVPRASPRRGGPRRRGRRPSS